MEKVELKGGILNSAFPDNKPLEYGCRTLSPARVGDCARFSGIEIAFCLDDLNPLR